MLLCRENSAVGDRVAEKIGRQISFLCNDAEKFVVRIHMKFCTSSRSSGVMGRAPFSMSLNLPLLKTTECEADFVKQLLVIQGLK